MAISPNIAPSDYYIASFFPVPGRSIPDLGVPFRQPMNPHNTLARWFQLPMSAAELATRLSVATAHVEPFTLTAGPRETMPTPGYRDGFVEVNYLQAEGDEPNGLEALSEVVATALDEVGAEYTVKSFLDHYTTHVTVQELFAGSRKEFGLEVGIEEGEQVAVNGLSLVSRYQPESEATKAYRVAAFIPLGGGEVIYAP